MKSLITALKSASYTYWFLWRQTKIFFWKFVFFIFRQSFFISLSRYLSLSFFLPLSRYLSLFVSLSFFLSLSFVSKFLALSLSFLAVCLCSWKAICFLSSMFTEHDSLTNHLGVLFCHTQSSSKVCQNWFKKKIKTRLHGLGTRFIKNNYLCFAHRKKFRVIFVLTVQEVLGDLLFEITLSDIFLPLSWNN